MNVSYLKTIAMVMFRILKLRWSYKNFPIWKFKEYTLKKCAIEFLFNEVF